ncbi:MAG: type II toxin-antitoxin system RelE/ParE family toxin [Candidatus Staskawiczbacteria bacterium]|nr:type II toxin-antitoxin system RelE/ParE family toxin [Candidatus Staskawiczbacteria bacterium]
MQIIYSPRFEGDYEKINEQLKIKAEMRENIFRNNPFDGRLKTHKLSGRFRDLWAFSVDYDCRIVFEFKSGKTVIFHAIGGHSIYN